MFNENEFNQLTNFINTGTHMKQTERESEKEGISNDDI